MNGRQHSINLAGSKLHYWVYGPSQNAPVIIAIHGFRGTHHGLERIIEHLPDYTVIVPDLPGFGESTPMTDYAHDIDGYAEIFKQFIPIITGKNDTVYLLGHSFGSIIASKLASTTDLGFKKLILINPIAHKPQIVGRLASILYFGLGGHLSEQLARRYFSSPFSINTMSWQLTKTKHAPTRAYVKAQHLTHFSEYGNRLTLHESFTASVSNSLTDYAASLSLPVLLIAGAQDIIAPLATQYKLYETLDTPTELAVIENVGHLVHYEKPAEVADFIKAFIDEA
jgi:pimeloyl-ACP methyl ester carboxylesterase